MSALSGYKTTAFSDTKKFLVLDPNTGSPSFVLGSDLVKQLTPNSNYVFSESTRTTAQATDYPIGSLIETAGATTAGDNFAAAYLVVAAGDGDFPMDNGNELLVIKGDELLREQLAFNASGEGSDLVAHTGTSDTVTEALDKRTIFVGSVAELEALSLAEGANVYLTEDSRAGEFVVKTGTPPSDPQKGIYIVLANGNYAERIYEGYLDPKWFGAIGDGTNDDRTAALAADAIGTVSPSSGTYNIGASVTFSSRWIMQNGSTLKPTASAKITFSNFFVSAEDGSGLDLADGTASLLDINVTVGTDYPTVQAAVDACPRRLHHFYVVNVPTGTWDEDVRIDGILASYVQPDTASTLETPRLIINGANNVLADPNILVGSIMTTGCSGGTSHPSYQKFSLLRGCPYTNESTAVEFYGTYGAATTGLGFASCTANRGIQAYDSLISAAQGNDFGTAQIDYAYSVKHGGIIYNKNLETADSGTLIKAPFRFQSGTIYSGNANQLNCNDLQYVFFDGVGALVDSSTGKVFTNTEGALGNRLNVTDLLSSIDGWADTSLAGGSWSIGASGGYLTASATGGTTAEAKLNRFTFFNSFDYAAFRIRIANVSTAIARTGDARFVFGDLASSYIGIRCFDDGTDRSIYGIVSDGVNAEQAIKLVAVTNDNGNPIECVLTGDQVRFYRFGSIVGRIDLAQTPANLGGTLFHFKNTTTGNGSSEYQVNLIALEQ